MKQYNERMRDLREDKDKTQQEISEILEISDVTYQYYEYGKREPKASTIIKLAQYYGTSTDYLLGLTDMRQPYPRAKGQ